MTTNSPSIPSGYVFDRAKLQEMAERIRGSKVVSAGLGCIPVVVDHPLLGSRNLLLKPPAIGEGAGGEPSCLFVTQEFIDSVVKPLCSKS